uniref:Uncharacterized protein n=1 Tax=Utricularia reniformis TaxID=192314 RepID=A0A1Y0B1S4_9LAMI|nr:hypothetical protein AEK19_MT1156 [Utricularia reniformis]ART31370.1 hypothetical protein AEK19_MT1156 [Utricularia reniformis]
MPSPTLDIYNWFSLISSHDLSHFNIECHFGNVKDMCFILNKLQMQGL